MDLFTFAAAAVIAFLIAAWTETKIRIPVVYFLTLGIVSFLPRKESSKPKKMLEAEKCYKFVECDLSDLLK
jgi:hypothetical protein